MNFERQRQCHINRLPDEMLLEIFRKIPNGEFLLTLPLVCQRWFKLVSLDMRTLKHIMQHFCCSEDSLLSNSLLSQNDFDNNLRSVVSLSRNSANLVPRQVVAYPRSKNLFSEYINFNKTIETVIFISSLRSCETPRFQTIPMENLRRVEFFQVVFNNGQLNVLLTLGSEHPNIINVMFVRCHLLRITE